MLNFKRSLWKTGRRPSRRARCRRCAASRWQVDHSKLASTQPPAGFRLGGSDPVPRRRRAAAIQAGAVPALCSILQAGAARHVPIALDDVLKALYALAAADASGHSASELFASGGIHSLVS